MLGILLAAVALAGCYGPASRQRCYRQGDCSAGSFCSASGFCWSECRSNRDCPCGSYCGAVCGICQRADNGKAATCFAHDRGLNDDEVAGTCRGGEAFDADPVGALSCQLPAPSCSIFVPQPSDDAVFDAAVAPDAGPVTTDADSDGGQS